MIFSNACAMSTQIITGHLVGVGVAGVYAGTAVEKDKVIDHEQVCPQHLPIVDLMKEASAILDA